MLIFFLANDFIVESVIINELKSISTHNKLVFKSYNIIIYHYHDDIILVNRVKLVS